MYDFLSVSNSNCMSISHCYSIGVIAIFFPISYHLGQILPCQNATVSFCSYPIQKSLFVTSYCLLCLYIAARESVYYPNFVHDININLNMYIDDKRSTALSEVFYSLYSPRIIPFGKNGSCHIRKMLLEVTVITSKPDTGPGTVVITHNNELIWKLKYKRRCRLHLMKQITSTSIYTERH